MFCYNPEPLVDFCSAFWCTWSLLLRSKEGYFKYECGFNYTVDLEDKHSYVVCFLNLKACNEEAFYRIWVTHIVLLTFFQLNRMLEIKYIKVIQEFVCTSTEQALFQNSTGPNLAGRKKLEKKVWAWNGPDSPGGFREKCFSNMFLGTRQLRLSGMLPSVPCLNLPPCEDKFPVCPIVLGQ